MENNINNDTNLSQISTEDLLKELESRGYKLPTLKKTISKALSISSKPQKQTTLNIDCKKIFNEKTQQELISLLKGYTKPEINEFYNQIIAREDIKLSGSKEDYISSVINLKKAVDRTKAFAKW